MNRLPIIAGNWKMNLDHLEATHLIQKLDWTLKDADHDYAKGEVVVIPPFTDLRSAQTLIDADKMGMKHGAQDVSTHESGAYTGEISGAMLSKLNVGYVLVGHSERRQYHGENDKKILVEKIRKVLENGMTPIFCVGEPLEIREANTHVEYILNQVMEVLTEFEASEIKDIVVAYEPVWAIGTGKSAGPEVAQDITSQIRGALSENFGKDFSEKIRIQYGGSVKSGTALDIMSGPDVDGLLVGGASLDAEEFSKIIRIATKVKE
jgi:triosephosphate isomerase